jgi:hypothetical protein
MPLLIWSTTRLRALYVLKYLRVASCIFTAKMSDLEMLISSRADFGFDIGGRDIQMEIDNDVSIFTYIVHTSKYLRFFTHRLWKCTQIM